MIAADNEDMLNSIKRKVANRFEMSDLGEIHYVLGMQIERRGNKLFMHQEKFAKEILDKHGMSDCKPLSTPRDQNEYLTKGETAMNPLQIKEYQSLIGQLMYLMLGTRPDIASAVGQVKQHVTNPDNQHWLAAKRILRYFKGTLRYGICFDGENGYLELTGFVDADWGGDRNDRKSTTGYVFMLAGAPISWVSTNQSVVALSSTEAEYVAAGYTTKEATWLRELLSSMHSPQNSATVIYEDYQGAIALTKNTVFMQGQSTSKLNIATFAMQANGK